MLACLTDEDFEALWSATAITNYLTWVCVLRFEFSNEMKWRRRNVRGGGEKDVGKSNYGLKCREEMKWEDEAQR